MGVELLEPRIVQPADSRLAIADCDIHPARRSRKDLYPFMEKRWQEHLETFGVRLRQAYQAGPAYPKGQPNAARRDAWPPGGTVPGSDLAFMKKQLLDPNNVRLGVLNATADNGQAFQNREFGVAYARAINRWLIAEWTSKEPRLKASIVAPYEDAEAALAEIEAYAGHSDFVQVLMLNRTAEPPGQKRYWPVYEAAARAGLPIGVHAFGFGGWPISGGGWPSYYIEDMVGHAQSCQTFLTSLVMEGVFQRFPGLRVVLIESGFAWVPSLCWRLDKLWARMRDEVPHVKRAPSEYIREHVWFSSQPREEPEPRQHLIDTMEWIGWRQLVFATDYPHWDYDDPASALPLPICDERRRMFLVGNALRLYGQA